MSCLEAGAHSHKEANLRRSRIGHPCQDNLVCHTLPDLTFYMPASDLSIAVTTDRCLFGRYAGRQVLDAVPVDREGGCCRRLTRHRPDMLHNSPRGLLHAAGRYLMEPGTTRRKRNMTSMFMGKHYCIESKGWSKDTDRDSCSGFRDYHDL